MKIMKIISSLVLLVVGAIFIGWAVDRQGKTDDLTRHEPAPAVIAAAPPVPDHNYLMQDGMKYGYPAALSSNDRSAGQAAEKLVMVLFAGERDGKYQAHLIDGTTVTALECASPCRYLKVMAYVDSPYLRDTIKTEMLVSNPQTIGFLIMQDAMNGKLKPYGRMIDGKPYQMWVDETKGMQRVPVRPRS